MINQKIKIMIVMIAATLFLMNTIATANYPTFNQHLFVNGAGYISVPNSPSLNSTLVSAGMFTIDAWIYPTSFSNYPTIVGNDWTAGYWLGLNTSGKLRFYPGGGVYKESNTAVSLNQWTHIAVSYNYFKGEVRFFINNNLDVLIQNFSIPIGTSNGDFRIAADRSGNTADFFFNGFIDEVRIWKTEIYFPTTDGSLYKIPHQFGDGEYGKSLISTWRLNGNAADSVGNNNGSEVGAVGWQTTNNPLHYSRICAVLMNNSPNSHDYFIIPNSATLSLTTSFTIECWVNLFTINGGATTFQTFINKGSYGSSALTYWLGVNKQNGKLRFVPNGVWSSALESTDPLPTNTWVHVAGRFSFSGNTGTATVFINGVPKGTTNFNSTASPNNLPLLIGTSDQQLQPPNSYPLSGKIDEVRIWDEALSNAAIGNNHRFELDGAVPNLVASYHFDGDVLDLSGSNNHGLNFNNASYDLHFLNASDLPSFPVLTVTTPNGGESWQIGSTKQIVWSSAGLTSLKIELSRDGGVSYPETINDSVSAPAGSYNWIVTGPVTTTARVRISPSTLSSINDESNANFDIVEPPPTLKVTPTILIFNGVQLDTPPPPQKIYLSNTGGRLLSWNATSGLPWIGVSPNTGTSNSDSTEVSMLTTNFLPGHYFDVITFKGNASNVPVTVNVSYNVLPPPHIDVFPTSVQFSTSTGINPPRKYVKIKNFSNGTLNWTASSSTLWFSFSPTSGTQNDSIGIDVDVTGLAADTYNGTVKITGNADNSPVQIPVQLIVSSVPLYPVSGKAVSGSVGIAGVAINITGDSVFSVATISDGSFSVGGLHAGSYVLTPSSPYYDFTPSSYTITGLNSSQSGILFTASPKSGSAKLHYKKGWNLISLPVDPSIHQVAVLFADAEVPPTAYRYSQDSGYIAETYINFGIGYWIKFIKDDSVTIHGTLRGDFSAMLSASSGGWNCIGGTSGTVPFSSIIQNPPGSIISIYQYNTGDTYQLIPGDLLRSGRGFFVKVSQDVNCGLYSSFTGSIEDLQHAEQLPSTLPDILSIPPPPSDR